MSGYDYRHTGWLLTKFALVGLLITYHVSCAFVMRDFRNGRNHHTHVYYRWYNEVPAVVLVVIVLLAVVKPF